jgi:hypothetical protein
MILWNFWFRCLFIVVADKVRHKLYAEPTELHKNSLLVVRSRYEYSDVIRVFTWWLETTRCAQQSTVTKLSVGLRFVWCNLGWLVRPTNQTKIVIQQKKKTIKE